LKVAPNEPHTAIQKVASDKAAQTPQKIQPTRECNPDWKRGNKRPTQEREKSESWNKRDKTEQKLTDTRENRRIIGRRNPTKRNDNHTE
jgi:hypothetical protein